MQLNFIFAEIFICKIKRSAAPDYKLIICDSPFIIVYYLIFPLVIANELIAIVLAVEFIFLIPNENTVIL